MARRPLREWREVPPGLRDQTPRIRPVLLMPDPYIQLTVLVVPDALPRCSQPGCFLRKRRGVFLRLFALISMGITRIPRRIMADTSRHSEACSFARPRETDRDAKKAAATAGSERITLGADRHRSLFRVSHAQQATGRQIPP